jgi:hypothetical protein
MPRRLLPLLCCFFLAMPAFCLWRTLKTEAFTVYYPEKREAEAREILEVLEYYRGYVGQLTGARTRRVAVVLEDIGLQSNGLTDVTFHRILLFSSAPSDGTLAYHQSWWRMVGVHEYTHWRHLSSASGLPGLLTTLFGNAMVPGNYTPGWLKEGICVVAESGTSPYEGRLNAGLFDAYATVLAQTGSLPTIVQATYNMDAFPGGTGPYLFGGEFVAYLSERYGKQKVARFFVHYGSSILSYLSPLLPAAGLDRSSRKVFGEPIRDLWLQWQRELMRSSVSFSRPEKAVTRHGWWLRAPLLDRENLFYQRRFPVKHGPFSTSWQYQLMRMDTKSGGTRVLYRSSAPFGAQMRLHAGRLYYALQELEQGYDNYYYDGYGFTTVLYSAELTEEGKLRKRRRLFQAPLRAFHVLSDGMILAAVDRKDSHGSQLRLYGAEGRSSEILLSSDLLISDIAADAEHLFVVAQAEWETARIYEVSLPGWTGAGASLSDLDAAALRFQPLHDTPFQEAELCLGEGGLFYSATYDARRTVYRYDLRSGGVHRAVASDFARAPAWDPAGGSLYYIGVNAGGEDLYREQLRLRPITVPGRRGPADVPGEADLELPEGMVQRGGYFHNLTTLLPKTLYPVEFGLFYPSWDFSIGAGIAGASALGDLSYTVLGFYESYFNRSQIQASLETRLLPPSSVTFDFIAAGDLQTAEFLELSLTLELPLHRSLGKGFSYLGLGTAASLVWEWPDESRLLLPYTVMGFQGAYSRLFLQAGAQFNHDVDADEFAYVLLPGLSASVVFLGVELILQLYSLYDPSGRYTWSFPSEWVPIGYDSALTGSWGGYLHSSLSIPLLRLRGGLWNPGLYLGDLFLIPYLAAATNQDSELQLSYGATFNLEVKAGARDEGYPVELYAGLGMTLEGQLLVFAGFRFVGYAGGYNHGSRSHRIPRPTPES